MGSRNDGPHDLGALLHRYRTSARMTQEDLAERAAMSSRTVRDIERGAVRAPRRSSVESLADALNLVGMARTIFLAAAEAARWQPSDRVGIDSSVTS